MNINFVNYMKGEDSTLTLSFVNQFPSLILTLLKGFMADPDDSPTPTRMSNFSVNIISLPVHGDWANFPVPIPQKCEQIQRSTSFFSTKPTPCQYPPSSLPCIPHDYVCS